MGSLVVWIAEKPKVALALAEAMGISGNKNMSEGAYISADGRTKITWGFGHLLRDYDPEEYSEKFRSWTLELLPIVPEVWKKAAAKFEPAKSQYFKVKKLIESADEVVLATDFDREGEVIGRELLVHFNYRKSVKRVNITAMDNASMKKLLTSSFDAASGMPLYYAGLGRAQIDWLFGLNLTRMATIMGKKLGFEGVLSAGRVQSAALNIIASREDDIANFTSKNHYTLRASLATGLHKFEANWLAPREVLSADKLLLDKTIAESKMQALKGVSGTITRLTGDDAYEKPFLPYSLSAAQIECGKRFNFSGDKTLSILQALYDKHKITSYPRTSCRYLPTGELEELAVTLSALKAMDPSISSAIDGLDTTLRSDAWDDEKVGAHYGLKPTTNQIDLTLLTEDELKVYKLVRDAFLIQFMPAAKYRKVALEVRPNNSDDIFMAKGSTLTSPGWMGYLQPLKNEDDTDADSQSVSVPELEVGTGITFEKLSIIDKKTQPPRYFTDASLIEIMTNCAPLVKDPEMKRTLKKICGIGTEATRADIIKTLFDRHYVEKKGKQIRITELGRSVLSVLPAQVKSVENTAYIEQQLDAISERKLSLDNFRAEMVEKLRAVFEGDIPDINLDKVIPKCPSCSKNLRCIKSKAGSKFWGCSGYPDCKETFNDVKGKPELEKTTKQPATKRKGIKK